MSATADNSGKPKRKRRWLQFSLRTLLVLVAVLVTVTVNGVWLGIQVNRANRQRAAWDHVLELGGTVFFEHQRRIVAGRDVMDQSHAPYPVWLPPFGDGQSQRVAALIIGDALARHARVDVVGAGNRLKQHVSG